MHLSAFYSPILLSFNPTLFSLSLFISTSLPISFFTLSPFHLYYRPPTLPSSSPVNPTTPPSPPQPSLSIPSIPARTTESNTHTRPGTIIRKARNVVRRRRKRRNLNLPRQTTNFQLHRIRDNFLRRPAQHTTTTTAGKAEG